MKTMTIIQSKGLDFDVKDIEKRAKEEWLNKGYKIKDINSLKIYFNADENKAYVVINELHTITVE